MYLLRNFLLGNVFLVSFLCPALSHAADEEDNNLSFENAWFKPELIEDNDAQCHELLQDASKKYFSPIEIQAGYGLAGYGYSKNGYVLDWKILGGHGLDTLNAYGKIFYLDYFRHPGCGGACESYQPLISIKPITESHDSEYVNTLVKDAPPAASYDYMIAENKDKIPYLFVVGEYDEYKNKLFVYKLISEGRWKKACLISFKPDQKRYANEANFLTAVNSINALKEKLAGMSQSSGYCGSSNTHGRWIVKVNDQLDQVLYRPWAIKYGTIKYGSATSENSYANYDKNMENFERWALNGLYEHKAFNGYNEQLTKTVSDVSYFYQKIYRWSEATSLRLADEAVKSAVSYGFGFYMYNPFDQKEFLIRDAITNKKSIDFISSMDFDYTNYINNSNGNDYFYSKENIINLAISRPDIVEFLLKKGIPVDVKNAFNKTPLMHAAQQDSVESAKILLAHNANPNAFTVIPEDDCYYRLSKSKMTALHYAVRYASPEFIKLLLSSGADPYVKTSESSGGYPIDWLQKYTDKNADEKNPNIPEDKIAEIAALLELPSAEELGGKVKALNLHAEEKYKKNDLQSAYDLTIKAINLNDKDERALSNLSLIAQRIGKSGEALEAIQQLIKTSKDNKKIANAWFNYGLICEQKESTYYNGSSYCRSPLIYYYLQSIKLAATTARSNKILSVINEQNEVCAFKNNTITVVPYCGSSLQDKKICILTSKGNVIDVAELSWNKKTYIPNKSNLPIHKTEKTGVSKLVSSHDLGEQVLHEYGITDAMHFPIYWGSQNCDASFNIQNGTIDL